MTAAAIHRLALSLDAFLVNGIPLGVLQRDFAAGFLDRVADDLLRDLRAMPRASETEPILDTLDRKCHALIETVTGLRDFATLPRERLLAEVAGIRPLRDECVRLIRQLEDRLGVEPRFAAIRPADSAALVEGFLANLETVFAEAWDRQNDLAGSPS